MSWQSELDAKLERWRWIVAGRPLPLEVCAYIDSQDGPVEDWEVLWIDGPLDPTTGTGCSTPIATFSTWREAMDWADIEAQKTKFPGARFREFYGPKTEWYQIHCDRWAAYQAGTGPHPFTYSRGYENYKEGDPL